MKDANGFFTIRLKATHDDGATIVPAAIVIVFAARGNAARKIAAKVKSSKLKRRLPGQFFAEVDELAAEAVGGQGGQGH